MQIDSKSPCGSCGKLNKCKTENKNRVRECGAYKPSEFYEMLGMSIEEKVDSFGKTIEFLNKTIRATEKERGRMTLDEAISKWIVPAIKNTWNEKKCKEILEALKQESKTEWIPVSERLPKGSDIVLLSLPPHISPDGEECSASVICGHYIGGKDKEWGLSDGDTYGYGIVSIRKGTNPIAWMPSPEPYKADEEVHDEKTD